jgi:hypothetical protein
MVSFMISINDSVCTKWDLYKLPPNFFYVTNRQRNGQNQPILLQINWFCLPVEIPTVDFLATIGGVIIASVASRAIMGAFTCTRLLNLRHSY